VLRNQMDMPVAVAMRKPGRTSFRGSEVIIYRCYDIWFYRAIVIIFFRGFGDSGKITL
jgi:hypothetical protein